VAERSCIECLRPTLKSHALNTFAAREPLVRDTYRTGSLLVNKDDEGRRSVRIPCHRATTLRRGSRRRSPGDALSHRLIRTHVPTPPIPCPAGSVAIRSMAVSVPTPRRPEPPPATGDGSFPGNAARWSCLPPITSLQGLSSKVSTAASAVASPDQDDQLQNPIPVTLGDLFDNPYCVLRCSWRAADSSIVPSGMGSLL
jgi:hypothetical protein